MDLDNNGFGDPFSCYFDYDASGNNTVDFEFFDSTVFSTDHPLSSGQSSIQVIPNPARDEIRIKGDQSQYQLEIFDTIGHLLNNMNSVMDSHPVDISSLPGGFYILKVMNKTGHTFATHKLVKY